MSPRPGDPTHHGNPQPALPAGEKHSRADGPEDRELSLQKLALAFHTAGDVEELGQSALRALTDGARLGFPTAMLFELDEDRGELRGRWLGPPPGPVEQHTARLEAFRALRIALDVGAEYPLVKALRAKAPVEVPSEDEPVLRDFLNSAPGQPRRVILLPLRGQDRSVGVLALGWAPGDGRTDPGDLSTAEFLAGHLGLALERRLAAASQLQQRRAFEALQSGVGSLLGGTNLGDALLTTAQTATRLARATRSLAWTYDEASRELTLAAQYVASSQAGGALDAVLPRFHEIAQACARQGGSLLYPDLREVPELGLSALPAVLPAVAVPLVAFGEIVGVLAVLERAPNADGQREQFSQADEDSLRVVAGLAALAIKATRLQEAGRDAQRALREAQRALVEAERLASLGELSGKLIEELRSPVGAISSFARRAERRLQRSDPSREDLSIICRESARLEELLAQQAHVTKPGKLRLAMQPLTQSVHEAVALIRGELNGRGVFLEETYADQMPELLLDGDRMKHIVLNILRSSLEAVTDGDTIRVETLREGDRVLLEIAHTGLQVPGEILDQLFVPFATTGPAGAGLGLAIAHQVIKEHGGEISVRTEGEWGAIFTISLPIRANQERRRAQDRRGGRDRRRPGRGEEAA